MFIPIRSDRPLRATPYVNYALIAINIVVFGVTYSLLRSPEPTFVRDLLLNKWLHNDPRSGVIVTQLWQFITYQFLHADEWHLIGNLIFLWVFGNAVEDRLGKVGYLFFYLAMGVMAGIGHWLTSDAPVLGASGSIAGVTGAFLALFPRTRITFLYFFFFIGAFEVPAMVVVLFYFVKDLFFFGANLGGGVAYTAHLAGNVAGFAVAMALLGPRLLPREPYDLFSLWTHKRRRDRFKKIVQKGYHAWDDVGKSGKGPAGKPTISPQDQAVIDQRQAISTAIGRHEMDRAATLYLQLIRDHGDQALSQRHQFELANHLAGDGQYAQAAKAYELLLKTYPRHDERAHAQLMLGLINARYLNRPNDARPLLQEASQRLHGDDAALARELLAEIG